MSDNLPKRFHTLPVELIYHILDQLDSLTIFLSCRNVCIRLNDITNTYSRYQVNELYFASFLSIGKIFVEIQIIGVLCGTYESE